MDPTRLLDLPDEILLGILQLVQQSDFRDFCSLIKSCNRLRVICQDPHLWTKVRLADTGPWLRGFVEILKELPVIGDTVSELDITLEGRQLCMTPTCLKKALMGCPKLEVLRIRLRDLLSTQGLTTRLRLLSIASSPSKEQSLGQWISKLGSVLRYRTDCFPCLKQLKLDASASSAPLRPSKRRRVLLARLFCLVNTRALPRLEELVLIGFDFNAVEGEGNPFVEEGEREEETVGPTVVAEGGRRWRWRKTVR